MPAWYKSCLRAFVSTSCDDKRYPSDPTQATFLSISHSTADADTDGDGMNNYAEYVAGTEPTNQQSIFFLQAGLSNTAGIVQFGSVSNRLYNIYWRTNISAGDWVLFRTNLAGNDAVISVSVSNQPAPSFYRSRVTFP